MTCDRSASAASCGEAFNWRGEPCKFAWRREQPFACLEDFLGQKQEREGEGSKTIFNNFHKNQLSRPIIGAPLRVVRLLAPLD